MQYQADYQTDQPATELATPWSRLAAVIIDILIYIVVAIPLALIAIFTFAAEQLENNDTTGLALFTLLGVVVVLIIQMVLLGTRGQTIGKIAMSIRVVDAQTGAHPGWPRLVLLRSIVNGILTSILVIGTIYWLVDSLFIFRADHRTIHDLYSGTRVDKL